MLLNNKKYITDRIRRLLNSEEYLYIVLIEKVANKFNIPFMFVNDSIALPHKLFYSVKIIQDCDNDIMWELMRDEKIKDALYIKLSQAIGSYNTKESAYILFSSVPKIHIDIISEKPKIELFHIEHRIVVTRNDGLIPFNSVIYDNDHAIRIEKERKSKEVDNMCNDLESTYIEWQTTKMNK